MPVPSHIDTERMVEVPWLEGLLADRRASALLDVGSADAHYLPALVQTGAAVTLLERGPFSLHHIPPCRLEVVYGDARELPAKWAGRFDLVTCVSVLDHLKHEATLQAAVGELRRVLAPRGRLLLSVPAGETWMGTHRDGFVQRVFSADQLAALLTGWELISSALWRLSGERYVPATWGDVATATYQHYRAGAVCCLEVERC